MSPGQNLRTHSPQGLPEEPWHPRGARAAAEGWQVPAEPTVPRSLAKFTVLWILGLTLWNNCTSGPGIPVSVLEVLHECRPLTSSKTCTQSASA